MQRQLPDLRQFQLQLLHFLRLRHLPLLRFLRLSLPQLHLRLLQHQPVSRLCVSLPLLRLPDPVHLLPARLALPRQLHLPDLQQPLSYMLWLADQLHLMQHLILQTLPRELRLSRQLPDCLLRCRNLQLSALRCPLQLLLGRHQPLLPHLLSRILTARHRLLLHLSLSLLLKWHQLSGLQLLPLSYLHSRR